MGAAERKIKMKTYYEEPKLEVIDIIGTDILTTSTLEPDPNDQGEVIE